MVRSLSYLSTLPKISNKSYGIINGYNSIGSKDNGVKYGASYIYDNQEFKKFEKYISQFDNSLDS